MFPKVKFVILYVGQDEILGAYARKEKVIYINPFRDDVTYIKFLVTWLHEFLHYLLRLTPKLDLLFEKLHYKFGIL